jgi:hypothetical protein
MRNKFIIGLIITGSNERNIKFGDEIFMARLLF